MQSLTVSLFQFHKVRLKARRSEAKKKFAKKFQFHKVRLKAWIGIYLLVRLDYTFQFHKVRLKVYRRPGYVKPVHYFNSIRYD